MNLLVFFLAIMLHSFSLYASDFQVKYPDVLEENVKKYSIQINTTNPEAQKLYDYGRLFWISFHDQEAYHYFSEAIIADKNCAMCYFGASLALRSQVSREADMAMILADDLLTKALHTENLTIKDRDYIKALETRYTQKKISNLLERDRSYSDALRRLVAKYPNDTELAVLFVRSLVSDTKIFREINETPLKAIKEARLVLGRAWKDPLENPGVIATMLKYPEISGSLDANTEAAERQINGAVKGIPNLDQLPATTLLWNERLHEASIANWKGFRVYEQFLEFSPATKDYDYRNYFKNLYFLFYTTLNEGRSKEALERAYELALHPLSINLPFELQDFYLGNYYLALARLGKWSDISLLPDPDLSYEFANTCYEYAKGLSALKTGNIENVDLHIRNIQKYVSRGEQSETLSDGNKTLIKLADLIKLDLQAQNYERKNHYELAINTYVSALTKQDRLPVFDPPLILLNIRDALGTTLLHAEEFEKAETIFLQALERGPKLPWTYLGLKLAQAKLKKRAEKLRSELKFLELWKYADFELLEPRF